MVRRKCTASGQERTPPLRDPLLDARDWMSADPLQKRGSVANNWDSVIPFKSASSVHRVRNANTNTGSSPLNLKDPLTASVSALMRRFASNIASVSRRVSRLSNR